MKVTLEPTTRIVEIGRPGRPGGPVARVWEGKTDAGVAVTCIVLRIAARRSDDNTALERELVEQRAPSPDAIAAWPARLVLS